MSSLIFAIDFDQTCCYDHDFPKVGKPIPGAIESLKLITSQGHKLILFTMRSGGELEDAIDWFFQNDIPLHAAQINPDQLNWTSSNKCHADYYLDDRAFGIPLLPDHKSDLGKNIVDWKKVIELMLSRGILI